ncbi:hypothetical protein LNP04_12995 [Chryseobacterium sp. C-71]|uniref:hypothetical protein n=1 Tax=Chryseobacterium sp. C-71 TaxID=2893882 RepID=UPI001E359BC7|nr:hypothetical protein [Chryseobacterium sp. C-71]UFH30892.1 hypothetical protein LNP04_12995 [Chryseobacterium sp. C-71]
MKKILYIITISFSISCNSQIISLEQEAQCLENSNCPQQYYAKDINNSLVKYIGIWKGEYDGKKYEMKFNKSLSENILGYKSDILKGRLKVSSLDGQTIFFNNFNEIDDEKTNFSGLSFTPNLVEYMTFFIGPSTQGCINDGTLYLKIKSNSPNQMTVFYWSEKDTVIGECSSTFSQTFPEKKLIYFTKQ